MKCWKTKGVDPNPSSDRGQCFLASNISTPQVAPTVAGSGWLVNGTGQDDRDRTASAV
jgi:hypothetical protein